MKTGLIATENSCCIMTVEHDIFGDNSYLVTEYAGKATNKEEAEWILKHRDGCESVALVC